MLKTLPLAVQQKQIVVTCNYEARRRGLRKLQLIKEARQICPELVIVLGEDLTKFRDASKSLYLFLRAFCWSGQVEKLGFDEVGWFPILLFGCCRVPTVCGILNPISDVRTTVVSGCHRHDYIQCGSSESKRSRTLVLSSQPSGSHTRFRIRCHWVPWFDLPCGSQRSLRFCLAMCSGGK